MSGPVLSVAVLAVVARLVVALAVPKSLALGSTRKGARSDSRFDYVCLWMIQLALIRACLPSVHIPIGSSQTFDYIITEPTRLPPWLTDSGVADRGDGMSFALAPGSPAETAVKMNQTDADIASKVSLALENDARVATGRLTLTVRSGIVWLRGIVSTRYERKLAKDIAGRLKGVRGVVNELEVEPSPGRSDQEIGADVQAATQRVLPHAASALQITVNDGIVAISGHVASYGEKSEAVGAAWQVPGVVDVVDNLQISPVVARTDATIEHEIRADLERNLTTDPRRIRVSVVGGVVKLSGVVDTLEQIWLADEIAWWTAGVRDVVNELTIAPTTQTARGST